MPEVKWIKITTDIFDDEKILLIESMPDAYAIITVWFKLLCLAGKQNNKGVFLLNDKIAYTDEMLAVIFRMNKNTVKLALDTFEQFGMIDRINGTITIPNWEKHQSLDALESKREYQKNLMRKRREKQRLLCDTNRDANRDANVSRLDKDKELDKEIDKDIKKEKNKKEPFFENEELNQAFLDFIEMRKKMNAPLNTKRAITLAVNKIKRLSNGDTTKAIEIIDQSIENGWKSLCEVKGKSNAVKNNRFNNFPQRENDFSSMEKMLLGG